MHGLANLPGSTEAGIFKQGDNSFARPCTLSNQFKNKMRIDKLRILEMSDPLILVPVHALEAVQLLPDGRGVAHVDRRRFVRRQIGLIRVGFRIHDSQ